MLAALRPESVAETEKVLFVDLVQYPYHRLLDDLVLQRGDADRSLAAIRFGYPYPLRGLRPVSAALYPLVEVQLSGLQSLTVLMPCHLVYSGCRVALERIVSSPEAAPP